MTESIDEKVRHVVISGAGIVGLVLALALKKHVGINAEICERLCEFHDNVGAGMCLFPNGLRVIRDISPDLLEQIRSSGYPLLLRRFERHDSNWCVEGDENARHTDIDEELHALGICRWRLQKILYDEVTKQCIKVHFNKQTESLERKSDCIKINFADGTYCCTRILFGVDGSKSTIRRIVAGKGYELDYTGVTCIMGIAKDFPVERGVSFPSSSTTECHACFFPTQQNEQCFQFYFPLPDKKDEDDWNVLTDKVSKLECENLFKRLRDDGWHEKYLAPLKYAEKAVRVGFCRLKPHLKTLVYTPKNKKSFVILVGDAAHPPDIYTGQGAQLGIEDAGVIALLLKQIYPNIAKENTTETFQSNTFKDAMDLYENMRAPRTKAILDQAHTMGAMQQRRASNERYNAMKEKMLSRDFFFHQNLPIYDDATKYDYCLDVQNTLQKMDGPKTA